MNEKDIKHFAIIYEALLINIDEYDPLYGVKYIGQSIPRYKQFNTPEDVLNNRKRRHIYLSIRDPKELGLMAALKKYGEDAFEWKILEYVYLTYIEGQKWANERETYYIKINGGVLKDMDNRFNQTLNLTKGGKGDPRSIYECIESRSNKSWHKFITHLEEYKKKYGDIKVPSKYICDDSYPLSQNIISVRGGNMVNYNNSRKEELLNKFPNWTWDIKVDKYTIFYNELSKYKDENGHCNVPQDYITLERYNLGNILNRIRQGQYIKYNLNRIDELTKLGVCWKPQKETRDTTWDYIQEQLLLYYNENGHSNVPRDYNKLGSYVGHIRSRQSFVKDNPERLQFLESINFSWNVRIDEEEESWLVFWYHMKKFYEDNKHCRVPNAFKCNEDDYALGSRCTSIRHANQYMNDINKRRRLEEIGFSWDPLGDTWEKFWKEICKYKKDNGHCKVPDKFVTEEGYRLGQTVVTVRKGTYLSGFPKRKKLLDDIEFIWSVFDKAWDEFLKQLINYMKNNNDSCENITRNYVSHDGYKLGSRINNIKSRQQFIKNEPERKAILKILGLSCNF
jgi:hypothetical protein